MRLVDLYCGAGMAADGYAQAGFDEIIGIDIVPQPNYPYHFIQADAELLLKHGVIECFEPDLVHASPPCQTHTRAKTLMRAQGGTPKSRDYLTPTIHYLKYESDLNYIIENVPGAPDMEDAVVCCGSSFDLGVRRHRLFKSNLQLERTKCDHKKQGRPWGIYHIAGDSIPKGGRTARDAKHGCEVMGVDRELSWKELKEGFPPAYTKFLGEQALKLL